MNVWESTLDDRYECKVVRKGEYDGELVIVDQTDHNIIHREDVVLSYGAQFGPDIGDVANWEQKSIMAVDAQA